jgi:hypothetical protein
MLRASIARHREDWTTANNANQGDRMDGLSPIERRTLIALAETGPASSFDSIAMSKLFTRGLVDVGPDRRLVLTGAGQTIYKKLLAEPKSA